MDILIRNSSPACLSCRVVIVAIVALFLNATVCGGTGGISGPKFLPGPADRINPIYDALVIYPDTILIINGMSYKGIELDLEIEFDELTLRDNDPLYTAEARVTSLRAGGVSQHYVLQGPLRIEGTLDGDVFTTGMFGGIQVGTANLLPTLTGLLDPTRSRIDGDATLFKAERYAWNHADVHEGWHALIKGKLEIRPIPGRHYEIVTQPHVPRRRPLSAGGHA